MRSYDPRGWYWVASDGRVYSSAQAKEVSPDDQAYLAFAAGGGIPTAWPKDQDGMESDNALRTVLAPYGIAFSRKEAMAAAVNVKRDAIIAAGYQHNFGGTAGIRTLDQRGPEDAINWLGLKGIADTAVAGGQGSMPIAIRDASDETFEASANVVSGAMVAMGQWRGAVMGHAWSLKDAIGEASDEVALDVIDIDAGWPGA